MSKLKENSNTDKKTLSNILMNSDNLGLNFFFKILVSGNFRLNQINSVYKNTKIKYTPAIRIEIEKKWSEIKLSYPKAFSSSLIRLNSFECNSKGELFLELCLSEYKEYRWAVSLSENERIKHNYNLANPLAAAIIIYSKKAFSNQGGILFAQRSSELPHHPDGLEFPSGNMDLNDLDINGNINPVITALREIREEQGIEEKDLENIKMLGIVYEFYQDAAPTSIIIADLKNDINLKELTQRKRDFEGKPVWLPANPDKLIKNILDYSLMCSPYVLAGIYLFLKLNYPEKAEYFLSKIKIKGNKYRKLSVGKLSEIERRKRIKFNKEFN